ncbi:MAG: family 16 glycosylhydrolase, partial [Clostridia bacterium]
ESKPQSITVELEKPVKVGEVGLAFGKGSERNYIFSVEVSEDNKNFTTVIEKTQSVKTNDLTSYRVNPVYGKYVRLTVYGRTDVSSGWIQVSEISVSNRDGDSGAGGVIVSRRMNLPSDGGDYRIDFDMSVSGDSNYSGITIGSGDITGGSDLVNRSAVQLRLQNSGSRIKVKYLRSNHFNEGSIREFMGTEFAKNMHFSLEISPSSRTSRITVSDSGKTETKELRFAFSNDEKTVSTVWDEAPSYIIFNSGAGAKCDIDITNLRITDLNNAVDFEDKAVNGIVRLEATRLKTDPTTNGEYFGRYVYHEGKADSKLGVKADVNPEQTRFVEREGLFGKGGVSLEAASMPGYFITDTVDGLVLSAFEDTADFRSRVTFIKEEKPNAGYYTGETVGYSSMRNRAALLNDNNTDYKIGTVSLSENSTAQKTTFYLRNEVESYVSDSFKGDTLDPQWHTNVPWGVNNPTNVSSASALIDYRNIIVKDGHVLLNATEIKANEWPKDTNGETGKSYNGSYGKSWEKFKGRTATISINTKVYNRQCLIEGSFKQPESPIGFWNSFWLTGRDSWPPEIDVFEFLSSTFGHTNWNSNIHGEGNKGNLFGKQTSSTDLTDGFHTFTMDWGYDYMKLYLDGKLFQRTQNNATLDFQKNMYLILACGLGGWEAEPDETMIWNDGMRIDWIRSYQYEEYEE